MRPRFFKRLDLEPAIRTSDSHPIRIDFVDHAAIPDKGSLGLTLAPGKYIRHKWDRNLDRDLDRLRREYEVDTLVTLLTVNEFQRLRLNGFFGRVNANGMEAVSMPLEQGKPPKDREEFAAGVAAIVERLRKGQRVVVHCSGGLGRSGMVAACCLVGFEVPPHEAVETVRGARRGAIEGGAQEELVAEFTARDVQVYSDHYLVEGPDVFPVEPDVEDVFKSLFRTPQDTSPPEKADLYRRFERYVLGDEVPRTPREAFLVMSELSGTYVGSRTLLCWVDEPRLRRMISTCVALRAAESHRIADSADRWTLLYASRAAELVEPLVRSIVASRPGPVRLVERQMLTCAALRFDGHAYVDATGFDWNEWEPERYAAEGDQLDAPEILSLFFASQRFLCKWGGEMLPDTHPHWWMYRELFLQAVDIQVPREYRHEDYWLEWKLRYEPRRDECVEVVATIHRRTEYDKELHQ